MWGWGMGPMGYGMNNPMNIGILSNVLNTSDLKFISKMAKRGHIIIGTTISVIASFWIGFFVTIGLIYNMSYINSENEIVFKGVIWWAPSIFFACLIVLLEILHWSFCIEFFKDIKYFKSKFDPKMNDLSIDRNSTNNFYQYNLNIDQMKYSTFARESMYWNYTSWFIWFGGIYSLIFILIALGKLKEYKMIIENKQSSTPPTIEPINHP